MKHILFNLSAYSMNSLTSKIVSMKSLNTIWMFLLICSTTSLIARNIPGKPNPKTILTELRAACAPATGYIEMDINNVRAGLRNGGDIWWNGDAGRFIVPKPEKGGKEVSALFAGAVWLGGYDSGGNLKLAAQTYRNAGNDFWPGPINEATINVTDQDCLDWDRFFVVYRDTIDNYRKYWRNNKDPQTGEIADLDAIPSSLKEWPAKGNPYFTSIFQYALPDNDAGLADYEDVDGNERYTPEGGDFPKIGIRGCQDAQTYPDMMVWWVYNDIGNIHTQSQAKQMAMEVQVQAFAWKSNDEINNMNFYRYKLINRGVDTLFNTVFAKWVDPDLGCSEDDYIGCDTSRSLMYVYNKDAVDGDQGSTCTGGAATYGNNIPLVGIDYFRGPLRDTNWVDKNGINRDSQIEIGMTSFMYFNREGNSAMTDPSLDIQYYNYMTSRWKDGTHVTFGGSGYNPSSTAFIDYVLTADPNDNSGWNMCTANLGNADRRTIQASGPFVLRPGVKNELIVGIVYVPDVEYPCPDISALQQVDETSQALFDNCFKLLDGPDAPDLDFIELDRELICLLTNDKENSNNYNELYQEVDKTAIVSDEELAKYRFEGYIIYQLKNANVTRQDFTNSDKARVVYKCDIKNKVEKIFNWTSYLDPGTKQVHYYPVEMVSGFNKGVGHSFTIKEDQFGSGNTRRLINNKKYYYTAVAYGYNNWKQFDTKDNSGQKKPYFEGRNNINTYTVIPRKTNWKNLKTVYGQQPAITRYSGVGTGGDTLQVSDDERVRMLSPNYDYKITYLPGAGPVNVRVYNPFEVKSGEYTLEFMDSDGSKTVTNEDRWQVRIKGTTDTVFSDRDISRINEQLITKYGISVTTGQIPDVGSLQDKKNGGLGCEISYKNPTGDQWVNFLGGNLDVPFNYAYNKDPRDPDNGLVNMCDGGLMPFTLTKYYPDTGQQFFFTPMWLDPTGSILQLGSNTPLKNLNNVDIVLTSNKDLWTQCVVVETGTEVTEVKDGSGNCVACKEGNARQFDPRQSPSVDKNGQPDPSAPNLKGYGYFPGYAVDIETGERVNIFFGENSVFRTAALENVFPLNCVNDVNNIGGDMIFNPNPITICQPIQAPINLIFGAHHIMYVTNQKYDACNQIYTELAKANKARKLLALKNVTWTGWILSSVPMKPISEGLIPNDVTMKLRVDHSYKKYLNASTLVDSFPKYSWKLEGVEATDLTNEAYPDALKNILITPNPYYGFSQYEGNRYATTVKLVNLPAKCTVDIFTLEGKFIRQYQRDLTPENQYKQGRSNPPVTEAQITPALEWDLKNEKGIPVAAGTYLIHVSAPGIGDRTLKFFGIQRQFDPTGL